MVSQWRRPWASRQSTTHFQRLFLMHAIHFTPFPLRYSATSLSPYSLLVVSSLAASIFHASRMSFRILRLSAFRSIAFLLFGFFVALLERYILQSEHQALL